jgi:hypothetical protein
MVPRTVVRMARTASARMDDTAVCMDDTVGDTVGGMPVGDTVGGMPAGDTAGGMPAGDTADGMPADDRPVDGTLADDTVPVDGMVPVDDTADDMELPLVRLLSGLSCLSKLERLLGPA